MTFSFISWIFILSPKFQKWAEKKKKKKKKNPPAGVEGGI